MEIWKAGLLVCLISVLFLLFFYIGLTRSQRLWAVSVAATSAINFSFFSGEIASRIAIPDLLFCITAICLVIRVALQKETQIFLAQTPLCLISSIFFCVLLSFFSAAWDRKMVLGEGQPATLLMVTLIFMLTTHYMKTEKDVTLFVRAMGVSVLFAVIMAFMDLADIGSPIEQVKRVDLDGFYGFSDIFSKNAIKHPYFSEYGFRIMGSFRTIGQLAAFSLTSFFMMTAASFLPHLSRKEQWSYRFLAACLVVAAVFTTRSSVYPSLFLGVGAALVLLFGRARKVFFPPIFLGAVAALIAIGWFVRNHPEVYQQVIVRNMKGIFDVLRGKGFLTEQLHSAKELLKDHLWFGIGYGRFVESPYHEFIRGYELHSTPVQFLAETGLIGFSAYVLFMGYFLVIAFQLVRRGWNTPWRRTYLMLLIGYVCMQPSYWYNRHLRERTFWLFVALIYSLWRFSEKAVLAEKKEKTQEGFIKQGANLCR